MTDLGLHVSVDDGIAELTLDRPPLNVFDMALLHAFADAIDDLGAQRDLRLIVIRGKGKAFSAGVSVGEHLGKDLAPMLEAFSRAAMRLLASEIPTLAVGHGAILGGALARPRSGWAWSRRSRRPTSPGSSACSARPRSSSRATP